MSSVGNDGDPMNGERFLDDSNVVVLTLSILHVLLLVRDRSSRSGYRSGREGGGLYRR